LFAILYQKYEDESMFKWVILLTFILNSGWAHENTSLPTPGMTLFMEKRYEEALLLFQNPQPADKEELNPLLGQLFCHIALGHTDQVAPTIYLIRQKVQEFTNCDTLPDRGPVTQEQQQMAYMCRRHVREIANRMRQTVEQLVRDTVPGMLAKIKMLRELYPFIDDLEQTGVECCQNTSPSECCMNPLIEQLESWSSFGLSSK
jgi:hypothetical protein